MSNTPLLQVKNLSLTRDGKPILRNVSLDVYPGQIHALLGLNGSGKSSLAYTLMGCAGYESDQGRILFDGQDVARLSIDRRARLGMTLAWQEPARFEGLLVGKYIALGMKEFDRERALDALKAVALPPRTYAIRTVNDTLSGGERKRVELAAIYAMQPRLAILDEPDSGIDALSLADVGTLIRRMAQAGTAVLFITHRDEMVTVADTASIMCLGNVIFTGSSAEAQEYYKGRCQPHLAQLGIQPWDISLPEVQSALASNGGQTDDADSED